MQVRAVSEPHAIVQTLMEVYVHLKWRTPYNTFANH